MKIVEFLQKTVNGELSLAEQKQYLANKPFGSAEEIAEAVEYLYGQMPQVPKLEGAIDMCGTGGSGLPRLNTSTISAFIAAGAGAKVAKHGNNAASGKFGSFDLLSALDVPINLSVSELQLRFNKYNLAFLYAKNFHPAMRFFAPVRSELKQPTFFNILGPLLSPIKAPRQLIGTPKVEYARLLSEVSKILGKERVITAVGSDGLDEVTLTGPTTVVELINGEIKEYEITPSDFGISPAKDFAEIAATDPEENVRLAKSILDGTEKTKKTDLVLINSAVALYLAGKSKDLKHCYELAKQALDSGKAKAVLDNYRMPSVMARIIERDGRRDFTVHANKPHNPTKYKGGLIAEIKRRSPSEGEINPGIDIAKQARIYEQAGASAISVLAEPEDFGGSFEDLKQVRQATSLPILCKDFIIRKEHIDKAKSCGADMVLLIAAALDEPKLRELHAHAAGLSLQVIVEVHNLAELEKISALNPEIIGVNSRNLHDFSLDPELFNRLSENIPKGAVKVAESGLSSYADVPKNYDGILVGTVLMRHPFTALKIKELLGIPLLKLCGIRSAEDARLCESLGVDMIGINFVPRSKRKVDVKTAKNIVGACDNTIPVGIFEDQPPSEVNEIAKASGVKAIQLSGHEKELDKHNLPIIKAIRLGEQKPPEAFMSLIDNIVAGSGKKIDHSALDEFEPSLIAGGIDLETAKELLASKKPLGFDTASGIETGDEVDRSKIKAFYELVASVRYGA
jgi:anthranilate phosphoribosyltransferase